MFERIKCYKRLKRADKLLRGSIEVGMILNNDEMIRTANDAIKKSEYIKKKIWFNRKMAKEYNLEFVKNGFK